MSVWCTLKHYSDTTLQKKCFFGSTQFNPSQSQELRTPLWFSTELFYSFSQKTFNFGKCFMEKILSLS